MGNEANRKGVNVDITNGGNVPTVPTPHKWDKDRMTLPNY